MAANAQSTTGPAGAESTSSTVNVAEQTTASLDTTVSLSNGVKVIDRVVGRGEPFKEGDAILVHYSGRLESGRKFDDTREQLVPSPFYVKLGGGRTVRGFDAGLRGMRVGGKRTIIIPADQGYGAEGRPPLVPPNSKLIFDAEVVDVARTAPPQDSPQM